ncbi:transposase [Rhodanobacter sp. 7MK24]|uniref:transposase n=1 Tax=Rhodanobacter sp. 7MK24 TaxID=2775922 RepID=UPI00177C046E|nr:transposase [Rhodanobacter sp. 7MK24]MBD8881828.1 transposase [Rhodanobacter sp. 7MK24]
MEQLNNNLLFRRFVGLNIDDAAWDHPTFSFNRDRLFDAEIAKGRSETADDGAVRSMKAIAQLERCRFPTAC